MRELFYKLMGISGEQVSKIVGNRVRFRGDVNPYWVVAAALVLGAVVFLMYRKAAPDVSPAKKYTLATLRTLFLALLLLMLLRPVWAFVIESSVRRELVVLIDSSTSMKVVDPRSDGGDLKRVAIANGTLEADKGLDQELKQTAGLDKVSRLDVVKAVLKSDKLDLMNRLARDYNVDTFSFDGTRKQIAEASFRKPADGNAAASPAATRPTAASQAAWVDALGAAGQQTAVGDTLQSVVAAKRGQPMAGIVLITDGANNMGSDPIAAAKLARDAHVPLYIYGVGITSPKNLVLGSIFAPGMAFIKDEVPVTVRLRSQGVANARVTLNLVGPDGVAKPVAEQMVTFDGDGEQAVAMKFAPDTKGDFTLKAVAEPTDAGVVELTTEDNEKADPLKVIDQKIKVLLVEQAPRWEFKYLMAHLLRDRRVDLKVVLVEAAPGLARGKGTPYLEKFPEDKRDLLGYDLVILGDVDPRVFSTAQFESLEEFVFRFGGGLAVVAGKKNNPWGYRKSVIEKMLPVDLDAAGPGTGTGPGGEEQNDKPVKLELTTAGKAAPMLRLSAEEKLSEQMWAKLPPVYWVAPVARPKPAAEVLLVDPSPARSTRFSKMPVIAVQPYGGGQVMFIGTDNTWRWRKNKGDEQYVQLWGQVVQRLALPHLLGESKRTRVSADKKEYATNEKVNLLARLYDEGFVPRSIPTLNAFLSETGPEDAAARTIILNRMGGPQDPNKAGGPDDKAGPRPRGGFDGMYAGEFNAPSKPGTYKVYFGPEIDRTFVMDITVVEPKLEPGDNTMNEAMLKAIAADTKGAFVREEGLFGLPDLIKADVPKVITNIEVEFWTSPLYFLLMLGLVTAEWVIRKMVSLK